MNAATQQQFMEKLRDRVTVLWDRPVSSTELVRTLMYRVINDPLLDQNSIRVGFFIIIVVENTFYSTVFWRLYERLNDVCAILPCLSILRALHESR